MKRGGVLFCLVGPAGSGKNTIEAELLRQRQGTITRSISVTSRQPRTGEVDGQDYFFVSVDEFNERVARGDFFEWEEVHGNYYGTLNDTLRQAVENGRDLLLVIEIRGALNVKKHFPSDTFITFLAPPSFDVLRSRMQARGGLNERQIAVRLDTARSEYRKMCEVVLQPGVAAVDYLVVNDDLKEACAAVAKILDVERSRISRFDRADLQAFCHVD